MEELIKIYFSDFNSSKSDGKRSKFANGQKKVLMISSQSTQDSHTKQQT